jgi:trimeric autotransporter adhesin
VSLDAPCGVSFADGSLYFADIITLRKVDPSTDWLTTVAGTGLAGPVGNRGKASRASLNTCWETVDHSGNVVFTGRDRVWVVAASTGTFYGQAMTAGDIYTVAGDGNYGFSGDGGPATSAALTDLDGVIEDSHGNLVIADANNNRVRVVAESTGTFYGQAMTAGDIYTVAGDGAAGFSGDGGPATSAELHQPVGVAVDGSGNLLIADLQNHRVRVVAAGTGTFYGKAMTVGDIYTIAGNGKSDFSGDGRAATTAQLNNSYGVALGTAGNLAIADTVNNRMQVVPASTGIFYGQPMTAGHIYTVAGDGTAGSPATAARHQRRNRLPGRGDGRRRREPAVQRHG